MLAIANNWTSFAKYRTTARIAIGIAGVLVAQSAILAMPSGEGRVAPVDPAPRSANANNSTSFSEPTWGRDTVTAGEADAISELSTPAPEQSPARFATKPQSSANRKINPPQIVYIPNVPSSIPTTASGATRDAR